jgi:GxxExxY protein
VEFEEITGTVISAALKVHSAIGPGVLESVYKTCLQHELQKTGLLVQAEVVLPVLYDGLRMDSGFRIDLLVENLLIVELKCVESILPIHKAQLLTYLRLANRPIGLLLNFNVVHLRDGLKRILNNKYRPLQSSVISSSL